MSDLEDLKKQLIAKLQAKIEPEKPLTQEDLLKHSELPSYEKQKRLRQELEKQQGSVYDLVQGELPPIKGKVQQPKSAFDEEVTDT